MQQENLIQIKYLQIKLYNYISDLKIKTSLKVEVNKLKNPEYVAKYAREKFLYSKDNEYVIKIK